MKTLLISLIILVSLNTYAQKVYSTSTPSGAVKVYAVQYAYQADLKVYGVKYDYQAIGNSGLWYFTEHSYQATKKVYFTNYDYQADLKIYFVNQSYKAGWNKPSKKYLLY